jgi:LmbE family N-acetylglucosaminyl deacetylase
MPVDGLARGRHDSADVWWARMIEAIIARPRGRPLRILCLGAHCDDVDIGCGGTLLKLLRADARIEVTWVAFSADAARARELKASARRFLKRAASARVITHAFRDSFFPAEYAALKDTFASLRGNADPDVIFTHHLEDRHQDHRIVGELTWSVFRRHLIVEYEIPKYDGGLPPPNAYVRLAPRDAEAKVRILMDAYGSQRTKPWFTADTFRGLMRLRGIEAGAPDGWAEGFQLRKLCIG